MEYTGHILEDPGCVVSKKTTQLGSLRGDPTYQTYGLIFDKPITWARQIKYVGVTLDDWLTFGTSSQFENG